MKIWILRDDEKDSHHPFAAYKDFNTFLEKNPGWEEYRLWQIKMQDPKFKEFLQHYQESNLT